MHIISNIALITINEMLLVQLISFLIFLFNINRLMFRPLQDVMRERDGYINQLKIDTLDAVNEFRSLADKLKGLESEVRIQALGKKRDLEESGASKASGIIVFIIIKYAKTPLMNFLRGQKEALAQEIKRLEDEKEDAKQRINTHFLQAKRAFRAELIDKATDLALERLPREITPEDNEKFTREFITSTQNE